MTKTVYQTDAAGYYVGPAIADESPLEQGVYLIPAGCVEIAPPAFTETQRACWNNGAWAVEDIPLPPQPEPVPPPPPTVDDVVIERRRRLAMGFDYDFGGGRGVHRIGTTELDMAGWDEVTKIALARHAMGATTPIAIVTDTGPADVTPADWLAILEAATAFRQPIWQASFALQTMDPIPADYTADTYWP